MQMGGFLFISPLFDFVYNILIILYRFFGSDLGLALIAIAVLSRLIVLPFTLRQLKNVDKNKAFQEKYKEIKNKYKNNKEKQTTELAKLQSEFLPGQLAGCFTLILQLILLIQINHVISNLLKYGAEGFNTVAYGFVDKFPEGASIDLDFLGNTLNLGKSAQDMGVTNLSESWPYLLIALFLVLTQYFSMKFMTGMSSVPKPEKEEPKKKSKKGKEETPSFAEVFQGTNKQMMMFFPIMLGFFSLNYPSGLSLYFATTSLFVIIQQMVMKKSEIIEKLQKRFGKEVDSKSVKNLKESKPDKVKKKKKSKKRSKK